MVAGDIEETMKIILLLVSWYHGPYAPSPYLPFYSMPACMAKAKELTRGEMYYKCEVIDYE